MHQCPLIVDLDGTLVHTDTLHELLTTSIFSNPLHLFSVLGWLSRGKAGFKHAMVRHSSLDAATLPYNRELITWLEQESNAGREIILCTGANQAIANQVAAHLGFFSEVIASDTSRNLTGQDKAALLTQRFGQGNFDYVGNAEVDLAIWQHARKAIVVNATSRVQQQAGAVAEVERAFPRKPVSVRDLIRVLRLHQWAKNLLLFVPVIASHNLGAGTDMLKLIVAFFAFSLCASSVYIINDLHDLDSDRHHAKNATGPSLPARYPWSPDGCWPRFYYLWRWWPDGWSTPGFLAC